MHVKLREAAPTSLDALSRAIRLEAIETAEGKNSSHSVQAVGLGAGAEGAKPILELLEHNQNTLEQLLKTVQQGPNNRTNQETTQNKDHATTPSLASHVANQATRLWIAIVRTLQDLPLTRYRETDGSRHCGSSADWNTSNGSRT